MKESPEKKLPDNRYNALAWITGDPEIGEGCWIGAFTLIDGLGGLKIGKFCDISCGAQILSHSTIKRCLTEHIHNKVDKRSTEIGDHVFVGSQAVILMGAKVGHHSVIAAGAVVTEGMIIEPYSLVVGVPAKVIRSTKKDINEWVRDAKKNK